MSLFNELTIILLSKILIKLNNFDNNVEDIVKLHQMEKNTLTLLDDKQKIFLQKLLKKIAKTNFYNINKISRDIVIFLENWYKESVDIENIKNELNLIKDILLDEIENIKESEYKLNKDVKRILNSNAEYYLQLKNAIETII